MDSLPCHVIYVNRNVGEDYLVRTNPNGHPPLSDRNHDETRQLVQPLLDTFGDVHVCATGSSCLSKLFELQDASMMSKTPTIILLDTPHDDWSPDRYPMPAVASPSPSFEYPPGAPEIHTPGEDLYGLNLLQKIITEAHLRSISKLVVPVPIISYDGQDSTTTGSMTDGAVESFSAPLSTLAAHRQLIRRCLDLGAIDVIISPLSSKCITTLEICAYKAHREASKEQQALLEVTKGRKRSWVGVNEQKPFAYLREAMVSSLMNDVCRLTPEDDQVPTAHIVVSTERQAAIAKAVGRWHFCAHSFSDDELLVTAMIMFKHALAMPELEQWRIPADQLISFLVSCRAAYNSFVPYHNFRHVVDVLQATFHFLVQIGALHPYPSSGQLVDQAPQKSPIASLLTPFEALTLLITAIGHDVGHPGVNNGFLATLNAPLAQLYNDRSILESFHCAAYSQILRRHWPAVFEDGKMRSLMISSILSTDMGLHFDYMKRLGDVQGKLQDQNSTDGWNGRQLEEYKSLACSLLIKCADVSNVARRHDTALKWMHILSEEFSRQASMESELEIKSSLMAPPKKDIISLSNAQLGFMNMFAIPLFQGVADIMPAMQYTVDELDINKGLFEQKVQEEKAKQQDVELERRGKLRQGTFSPKTRSYVGDAEDESKQLTPQVDKQEDSPPIVTESSLQLPPAEKVDDVPPQDNQVVTPSPPNQITIKPFYGGGATDEFGQANGTISSFDAVRELADSDPFHCRAREGSGSENKSIPPSGRQRSSETTEGSASGAFAGDWASQATSATTGKMALSPSTQGTSIVSIESLERTVSASGLNMSPHSAKGSPATVQRDPWHGDGESASTGSIGRAEGKSLKKKPSRFRMKDFPFFRRSKGSSPTLPAADAAI